ncbi:MAG: hypothetical protein Q8N03_13210 [Ignavibacteria bacterium]|nr:hypothetical protein [Ignavibacteria bacterium]
MTRFKLLLLIWLCILNAITILAQVEYSVLIKSSLEDETVICSVDQPVYYPGDTVQITIKRGSTSSKVTVVPILILEEAVLKSVEKNIYTTVVPTAIPPGFYPIRVRVKDTQGRRFDYSTGCSIHVEEHQFIEDISKYVHIEPLVGSENINTPVTLERYQIRDLRVLFERDSIGIGMGPQFVTIKTSVQSRDGSLIQTFERRVLTFRSDKDPDRDRAMLIQYRNAYGAYAAIRSVEFSEVQIVTDSLPDWAIIKVSIEPDYTIKIGGYNRENVYNRYFRVKGPMIEMGVTLGIPKVLYDSQAKDTLIYGNSSAMLRFYYVDVVTGERFPVNFGIGTFGVNSPIDVTPNGGGFALSILFNIADMTRIIGIDLVKKISAGLEFTPFFPIKKRARFLINAQVGLAF